MQFSDVSYKTLATKNFSSVEVVPGEFQFSKYSTPFRKMPKTGDLLSSNNYLDILFWLMYEDLFRGLREGVEAMRNLKKPEGEILIIK